MTYQPYLISQYQTGFDRELQPWLLPVDAQDTLLDGYVYKGVWQKREGYDQLAIGTKGGTPYCESRMVHTVTINSNEAANGVRTTFTFTVSGSYFPLRRGGFRALDKNAATPPVTTQSIKDDGLGGTLAGSNGTINSVINYTSALATPQSVTFTVAPAGGHTITLELDIHQGLPVMGVMNFYADNNTQSLIVADTQYVNRYNSSTNRLDDISQTSLPTAGDKFDFMSWTNYPTAEDDARLLFVNNVSAIQRYSGGTTIGSVTPYPVYTDTGTPLTGQAYATGTVSPGPYVWGSPVAVLPGSVTIITAGKANTTDDSFGNLIGTDVSSGTIDYLTGAATLTYTSNVPAQPITINYTPMTDAIDTCLHIFQFKDRLVLLRPVESGAIKGRRIRISGTGAMCDVFTQDATGAGFIDIPDQSFIISADFNRDDLIIFTENSTWALKYTGNDTVPFELKKLDGTRGSGAPHGTISYLNLTSTQSPLGFIACDGYSIERTDDKIPTYSYEEIDQDTFSLCFAGAVDQDRDHYLIHPTSSQTEAESKSDVVLVTNYEEFNFSVYRIPLSCMGTFLESFDITWDDLAPPRFNNWDEMSAEFGSWDAFAYTKGTPFAVGGGHEGQVFRLNVSETEDYPVKIRDIQVVDKLTLTITTDFQNYKVGDIIYLNGISGTTEANNKQGSVTSRIDNYTFTLAMDCQEQDYSPFTTTSIGLATKVINFESVTKKFNPFSEMDKKVRCGWLYFYVSTSGTTLTDIEGNSVDALLTVQVFVNDVEDPTVVAVQDPPPYIINMTNLSTEVGTKKWYKIWINQTGRFIQFKVLNAQAGAKVKIQAMMPGFLPTGRLI